jgi:hypothetical protein
MAKLFLDKNYKEFVKFIYQPSIDIIGGKEMAIQLIEKAVDKLASDGFQITNCAIKKPEFIIHYKNELQCTVIQYLVMKSSKRMFYSKSTLIGFSKNNGESWTFFETSGKDLKTLQSTFKDLSDSLTISEETQSVFFKK